MKAMHVRPTVTLLLAGLLIAACATSPSSDNSRRNGMDRVSPVRAAEINTRLGIGYLERGQLQVAMEKLQVAIERDPEHVPAHFTLAVIHERLDENDRAGRHYRRAARLAPADGGVQNGYAAWLCRRGEYEEARRRFEKALDDRFYDTPEVVLTNAGSCARRAGELDQAGQYLRQALNNNAEYADALYHLARVLYQQGEPFRARAFLQRYEAVDSPSPGSLMLGYRIETALGNAGDAQRYVARLENDFPDSGEARELRQQRQDND